MTPHDLPQVVEFGNRYEIRTETTECGGTRVVARLKPSKINPNYKRFHDLPFVNHDVAKDTWHFWWFSKSSNGREQQERGTYFWNEFVRFVRGPQRRRREDSRFYAKILLQSALRNYPDGHAEASVFLDYLVDALVSHLRVGLDEGKREGEA